MRRWIRLWQVGLGGLLVTCAPPRTTSERQLQDCRLAGLPELARCGSLTVEENRAQPNGRQLELHYAVIPASAGTPRPDPLVILVGGPGQAATQAGAALAASFGKVRRFRDIVLVDQRGTGLSHPLTCPEQDPSLEKRFTQQLTAQDARDCLAGLSADTTQYATPMAVEDLEAVRHALGYGPWNVWGGSYGTRVALAYMQRFPDAIRRVVLDGVAPTAMKVPLNFARDGQRAFGLINKACAENPQCKAAFPSPQATLDALLQRLQDAPVAASLANPASGILTRVEINRQGFASGLRSLLYSAELSSLVPLILREAAERDNWAPFVGAITTLTEGMKDQPLAGGMYLSVMCAEDVSRISDEDVAASFEGTFAGRDLVDQMRSACRAWPVNRLPEEYFEPVATLHPTLVLSGDLDPATPPHWGRWVAQHLPNSVAVTVAGVGHGTSTIGCMPNLVAGFLETEEPARLDPTCAQQQARPPFFTRLTGP